MVESDDKFTDSGQHVGRERYDSNVMQTELRRKRFQGSEAGENEQTS